MDEHPSESAVEYSSGFLFDRVKGSETAQTKERAVLYAAVLEISPYSDYVLRKRFSCGATN